MVDLPEAVLILIIVGVAAFYAWYAFPVIRKKPVTGAESLVGAKGIVYSERLDSDGEVSIDGVIWRACLAETTAGPLKRGDAVTVKGVEDLMLIIDANTKLAETS
jgi:membrane protein implicated in regulation of membrane protease activity